jgi:hypothetical protein
LVSRRIRLLQTEGVDWESIILKYTGSHVNLWVVSGWIRVHPRLDETESPAVVCIFKLPPRGHVYTDSHIDI